VQKTALGQYSTVPLEQAKLKSSLLYDTPWKLQNARNDRFHGNGASGKILTKKEPIKTLVFTSRLPHLIIHQIFSLARDWSKHVT